MMHFGNGDKPNNNHDTTSTIHLATVLSQQGHRHQYTELFRHRTGQSPDRQYLQRADVLFVELIVDVS